MEGLLFLAGLVILFSLLILPVAVIVALRRGRDNREELHKLRESMALLRKELAARPPLAQPETQTQTQTQTQTSAPTPTPSPAPQPAAATPQRVSPAVSPWLDKKPPATASAQPAPPATPHREVRDEPLPVPQDVAADKIGGLFSGLLAWFIKGNPLAKLGILLLFFGLAYLLKYTVERGLLSIELRLAGAALTGVALLGLGWRLRLKQPLYALILQGGAIGALYITVFAAFRPYQLLPHILTFALMLTICAASVGLAVLQRALSLAMLASIGGYLSPILLSTGSNNYVGLFSYYLLLSVGILAVTVWQPWRPLNLLGFLFSFGVAGLWGMNNYVPDNYLFCQLFLIANIVIFGVLCIALSLRYHIAGEKVIDGVLLFGPPLIGFGMQYVITRHWAFGPAYSALGFGLAYLLLGWAALRRYPALGRQLAVSGLALGGAFTTLAIPLALSAQWTAMAWALEGLGILWLGITQRQMRMSLSGTGLLVLALISALVACDNVINALSFTLIFAVLALTWLAGAYLWRSVQALVSRVLLAGGILFWLAALCGALDIDIFSPQRFIFSLLALIALSTVIWHQAGRRLAWRELGYAVWVLWPAIALTLLFYIVTQMPLSAAGWLNLVWLLVLPVAYLLLRRESAALKPEVLPAGLHLSLFWMVLLALGYEVYWQTQALAWGRDEWRIAAWMLFVALVILSVQFALRRRYWPFSAYPHLYGALALLPLLPVALVLLIAGNLYDGIVPGWRYLPVINPLEEGAGFVLLALLVWGLFMREAGVGPQAWLRQALLPSCAALAFWWGNGVVLRALAYYGDIAWQPETLWTSRLVQTTFALLWMLLALFIMLWATRHRWRKGWFCGAALLSVVIVKLMLIDSARGGGLARAVAFIGVAVLVLIVGYFSPLPPRAESVREAETEQ